MFTASKSRNYMPSSLKFKNQEAPNTDTAGSLRL